MAEDPQLQIKIEGVLRNFSTRLKCHVLKLEHLASDIRALGDMPSTGAIEIVWKKYEPESQRECLRTLR